MNPNAEPVLSTEGLIVKNDLDSLLVVFGSLTSVSLDYNIQIRIKNRMTVPDENKKMTKFLEKKLHLNSDRHCWKSFPLAGSGVQTVHFLMYIEKDSPTKLLRTKFMRDIIREAGKKLDGQCQSKVSNLSDFHIHDMRRQLVIFKDDWESFAKNIDEKLKTSTFMAENGISHVFFYGTYDGIIFGSLALPFIYLFIYFISSVASHGLKNEKSEALDDMLKVMNIIPSHEKIILIQAHVAIRLIGKEGEALMLDVKLAKNLLKKATEIPDNSFQKYSFSNYLKYFLEDVGHLTYEFSYFSFNLFISKNL